MRAYNPRLTREGMVVVPSFSLLFFFLSLSAPPYLRTYYDYIIIRYLYAFIFFTFGGVLISRFVLDVPASVQFHHDITFCLESDSIVVSFSSGTSFLRVDILQFWSNVSPAISFHPVFMVHCCFYRQLTNEKWRVREFSSFRKSKKKTNMFSRT